MRADGLLLNILPPKIAERLKVDRRHIAEQFDEVTILFADVVGFEATYELVRDQFECEPRGLVEVTGKASVQTWYLSGLMAA